MLFVHGCVSEEVILDTNVSNDSAQDNRISLPSQPIVSQAPVVNSSKQQISEKRLREFEAFGFGIFNYTVLTVETCPGHYEHLRDKLQELRDDLKDAEEDLHDETDDVDEVMRELEAVQQSGNQNAVEHLKERIDQEEDERKAAEDTLDDLHDLYQRHIIIKNEIKKYCLELQATT